MPAPLRSSESSHGRLGGRRYAEFEIFEKAVSDDGVRRRYGVVENVPLLIWQDPSSTSGRTERSSRESNQ